MCRWRQTGRETSFLMILTMVCISNSRSLQPLPEVRFYCHTDGYRVFPDHWAKSVERIHYLADRRNAANSKALASLLPFRNQAANTIIYLAAPISILLSPLTLFSGMIFLTS